MKMSYVTLKKTHDIISQYNDIISQYSDMQMLLNRQYNHLTDNRDNRRSKLPDYER